MIVAEPAAPVLYTEALSRGGVRLAELRALAKVWRPGESVVAFTERIRHDDVLGKATARTVQDYVRAFGFRFTTPTDRAARHLQRLTAPGVPRQVFDDVAWHYVAANDHLLRDFAVLAVWPAARDGRLSISIDDARRFIGEAEADGRIPKRWSEGVRKDMPARILNALSEFGLLGELKAGKRAIQSYRPADGTIAYLAYLLHGDGVSDAALAENCAWAPYGLEPLDVWHRLEGLAADGWLILQRAGQVARITWTRGSVEEVIDALARRDV